MKEIRRRPLDLAMLLFVSAGAITLLSRTISSWLPGHTRTYHHINLGQVISAVRWGMIPFRCDSKARDPLPERFFHRNPNAMDISICPHSSCIKVIAIKLRTWRDSCVVSVNYFSDMIPYNGFTLKSIFHQIWITMESRSWNEPHVMIWTWHQQCNLLRN